MKETWYRSLAKAATWRIIGITVLFIVALAFGIGIFKSLGITLVTHGIKFIVNYFHERWWNRIKWGKIYYE